MCFNWLPEFWLGSLIYTPIGNRRLSAMPTRSKVPYFDCNFANSRAQTAHLQGSPYFWEAFDERTRMLLGSHDEVVSGADAVPVPPGSSAPEIKVEPADAILRFAPPKDDEKVSTRKGSSVFGRLLRLGARMAAVACLCGAAWAAGAYYSGGHSPLEFLKPSRASDVQQSPERDEIVRSMAQMAEEIRALKASVEGRSVAQDAGVESATRAAIADLASRVDKLEAESTTKLSRVNEQLASIEQQIAASYAALASRGRTPHKRVEHPRDAFDPTKDPSAPGAPRPLGAW